MRYWFQTYFDTRKAWHQPANIYMFVELQQLKSRLKKTLTCLSAPHLQYRLQTEPHRRCLSMKLRWNTPALSIYFAGATWSVPLLTQTNTHTTPRGQLLYLLHMFALPHMGTLVYIILCIDCTYWLRVYRIQMKEVVRIANMVPIGMDLWASLRSPDLLDPAIMPEI